MNFSTLAARSRQVALPWKAPYLTLRNRYSLFYFSYLSLWAVSHAFLPIHMKSLGFAPHEIGILGIILNVAAIVSPPIVLSAAYSKYSSRTLLYTLTFLLPLSFVPLIFVKTFSPFALAYLIFNLLFRTPFALVEPQAVRDSESNLMVYEHARSWGSLGYVMCMLAIGFLLDSNHNEVIFVLALTLLLGTFLSGGLIAGRLREHPTKQIVQINDEGVPWWRFGNQSFWSLMAICSLIWGSHSVMSLYLTLYLEELGWSGTMIATLWMIGVLGEIVVFYLFGRLARLFRLQTLLAVCIGMTIVRWSLYGLCDSVFWILTAQALHMFSFGGVYFLSVKLIYRFLSEDQRDRGQGILLTAGPGCGLMVGNIVTTFAAAGVTSYREVSSLFLGAAVVAALAFLFLPFLKLEETHRL